MKGVQFTIEEKQLLIEALLFTASCDVCSDHTNKHRVDMVSLAEKLNDPGQKLYNIYLYETDILEDKVITENIKKKFTNLPRQTVITD
jgi:hypothetical protein